MDFDNLNVELEQKKNNKTKDNIFTNFINDFQKVINNFFNNQFSLSLNNSIYVIRDINDSKLSLINIQNGQESNIYVVNSKEELNKLNNEGIFNNIYKISKEDLYHLNLGSNITLINGICVPYSKEIKIENSEVAAKLEDMYFCLEQEKDSIYSVSSISNNKIYLTDTKEGGYFSISQEAYPNLKVGDLVKYINGKYILI